MKIMNAAYHVAGSAVFAAGLPAFLLYTRLTGRYRRGLRERLGFVPLNVPPRLTGRPRLWIQAVSLGEVHVASAVVPALKDRMPRCSIVVSTATDHGYDLAREVLGDGIPVIYAPLDTVFSVGRALRRIRPDVMIFLETEIWPAWISLAHGMGIRTALVNGRISERSFRGYLRFRAFFRPVLAGIDAFSMIGEEDAERIRAMGADPARIVVNGNAKFDLLERRADPAAKEEMERALNLRGGEPVLVAGSTRGGEEAQILEAFECIRETFPDAVLVIAPRHIERSREVAAMASERGLSTQFRSDLLESGGKRTAPVLILNTFGELFRLYSASTLVFCGGSLVPLGGQNPLEAAVWGKPVFYGPHMDGFLGAKALLEAQGAGGTVTGPAMLAEEAIRLLQTPSELADRGRRAREAVLQNRHAAEDHAATVADLLSWIS